MTIDHAMARAEGEAGMRAAIEAAERSHMDWPELALRYFEFYCRAHLVVIVEEVVAASKRYGLVQPPSDRAWGWVVKRAKKAGMIHYDGTAPRVKGHGSPGPKWRSLIFCVPAN